MSAPALKALDEALYEVSGGLIVRGGALTAKPNEAHRRLIRTFKQTQAMREDKAMRRHGKDWMFEDDSDDEDRDATLEMLFAASR